MTQNQVAIQLDNVSVHYHAPTEQISGVKDFVIRWLQGKLFSKTFQAVKDVSFTVERGEVFGLIGPNGAGKSTLLKLVARVLQPSQGRVQTFGKVAPLLALGAGFHPELTGRENIFLNGSILGFSSREMKSKFSEIVDFAELWEFIDAPLRTYSSGMWARLGFAVATALQPDILIVDEVLSVGDEAFQRKSTERIEQFREQGTTILLVSHNAMTIEAMCNRVAWLDHGVLQAIGPADEVVGKYLHQVTEEWGSHIDLGEKKIDSTVRWGTHSANITGVRILDETGKERRVFQTGESLILELSYSAPKKITSPIFGLAIYRQDGFHVTGPNTLFSNFPLGQIEGEGKIQYRIPSLPLLNGVYQFSVSIVNRENIILDFHHRVYSFRVANDVGGIKEQYGLVTLFGNWRHL
jgi:lipopolysaccharide transport system ATP-binding protein